MRRDRGDPAFLYDMLKAARDVLRFVHGKSRVEYDADDILQAAVERKVEIIGEAARNLSKGFRDGNPQVPWQQITTTRHILAHDYDTVNHDTVWRIVTMHVPDLIGQLTPLLPPPPPDPLPEG
jgi:uncharacterized protein with HEPN domain